MLPRIFLTWLLLALLAVPSLGHMHALLHAAVGVELPQSSLSTPHARSTDATPEPKPDQSALAALLAEHPGAADCLLFDHLTLADTVASVAGSLSLTLEPAPPIGAALPTPTLQRQVAFRARAPPQRA